MVSSLSPSRCHLSYSKYCHVTELYHTSFIWSQDEVGASALSFSNASSRRISFRAETEELNQHHHHWPPSPNSSTPTLYWYKKFIQTLTTLPTIQPCIHCVFSLARASHHWSSTNYCCFELLSSYAHHPSTQWHSGWWTSRSSFTFWITYRHVNSYKKIF
jgi:hypothetical protein